jgi:hypothetical protein
MAERPDGASAERAESALRQSLRESGLAWIVEQVDEGLTQMASDQDQPPSAETRLEALIDAVVFAFELAEATEIGTLNLFAMEDLPADQRIGFAGIEFVDPLGREPTRRLGRDLETGEAAVNALRNAADELRVNIDEGPQR